MTTPRGVTIAPRPPLPGRRPFGWSVGAWSLNAAAFNRALLLTIAAALLPAASAAKGSGAAGGVPDAIGQLLGGATCISVGDARICEVPSARLEGFEPGRRRFLLAGGSTGAPKLGGAPQSAYSQKVFGGADKRGGIFRGSESGSHLRHLVLPAVRAAIPTGKLQTAHFVKERAVLVKHDPVITTALLNGEMIGEVSKNSWCIADEEVVLPLLILHKGAPRLRRARLARLRAEHALPLLADAYGGGPLLSTLVYDDESKRKTTTTVADAKAAPHGTAETASPARRRTLTRGCSSRATASSSGTPTTESP